MQEAMVDASRIVLDGFELRTDATIVCYPDRYIDGRAGGMWKTVFELIQGLEAEASASIEPVIVLSGGLSVPE